MAKYLYGIIRVADSKGLPAVTADRSAEWVRVRDLACAVSDVKLVERYEPTQADLLLHNRVLEQLMEQTPIIPMSIGTIAEDAAQVEGLLDQGYQIFDETLDRIQGKVQFTLDVQWQPEAMRAVAERDERVARFKDELRQRGGQPTLQDRVALGQLVASALNEQAPAVREAIIKALRPVLSKHQPIDRKSPAFFFSAAFLVDRHRAAEFENAIHQLGEQVGTQVKITYAGPLAPYNFVDLAIQLVSDEQLTEAVDLLELREPLTIAAIKAGYRAKAALTHPDRAQDPVAAKRQFEQVTKAYQLLVGFLRAQTDDEHHPIFVTNEELKTPRLVVVPQMEAIEV
jgi:hypothetical protein